jgi:hypothetical protein
MVQPTARSCKPAPITVHVAVLDLHAGLWSALSSDGSTWYMQDLRQHTCSCPAGQDGFRRCKKGACKHVIAARVWARALASMPPAARAVALRFTRVTINVHRVDVAALSQPLARSDAAA